MHVIVADRMHRKVLTAGAAQSSEEAWGRMQRHKVRHLVVLRDGKVAGVLSERDLAGERGIEMRRGRSVERMMTPAAVTVAPGASLHEAARLMRTHNIGCLPVVHEGRLRGIITTTDLLEFVLEHPEACAAGSGTAGP